MDRSSISITSGIIPLVIFLSGCSSNLCSSFSSPNDMLSFCYGYAVQKEFESTGTSQSINQFLAGMEVARKGDPLPFTDEELREALTKFEGAIIEQQKIKNLELAEEYLKTISLDPSVVELVHQKLYYKQIKQGDGDLIGPEDILLANYSAAVLESGNETTVFSPEMAPTSISLGDTIPGFAQGVEGMRIGERRKLFIHPDLAYGTFGGKIDPNQLLIIEIEVVGTTRE